MSVGGCLDPEFTDASFDFNEQYLGIAMRQSTGQLAAQQVQALLADYLGRAYVTAHFSEKAKQDVEEMIGEFITIYKARIESLDWSLYPLYGIARQAKPRGRPRKVEDGDDA